MYNAAGREKHYIIKMDRQGVLIFLGPTFFKINVVVERQKEQWALSNSRN